MNPDDRTPVLVGIGVVKQKCADPRDAVEAIALMQQAASRAVDDCSAAEIVEVIGAISVPKGIWSYSNPAALIAADIGASQARTVYAEIGIMQQTLIGAACKQIADGELDAALVVGGEAKHRQLQAKIQGLEITDTVQNDSLPDTCLQPDAELWSEIETNAGLGMPVGYYAMIESALCHANGISMDAHRDAIAAEYSRFSEIAVANPHAWSSEVVAPDAIRDASKSNRMMAFPYTKNHNSQWNVDQASALLFCSAAKARQLGIPETKWVYPLASTESNHMLVVSQRPALHRSAGARIAGQRALERAGLEINEIDFLELYSCFPAAVSLFARELGVVRDRDLTVTGGMTFAGGPLNNFVLQATARLAECLRAKPGSRGLVSCVSGMFTKQGYGLWSTSPNPGGFAFEDVSEEVASVELPVELINPIPGLVTVIAHTVLFDAEFPQRLVVLCEYGDGRRTVSWSTEPETLAEYLQHECVGREIELDAAGQICL